jgi:EAL domain-containing protein (putative c-di-GMP-specific phosphodiesterase class I)
VSLAVNMSARQLVHRGLVAMVADALETSKLPATRLTLELTESSVMHDVDLAYQVLAQLRSLGIRIAIDDFGTGWSSFAYLKRFEVDVVKIDRTFTAGVAASADDRVIVDAIAALADALGLGVVAEGVETSEQLRELVSLGIDRGQGFLWAPALENSEFIARFLRPSPADLSGAKPQAGRFGMSRGAGELAALISASSREIEPAARAVQHLTNLFATFQSRHWDNWPSEFGDLTDFSPTNG